MILHVLNISHEELKGLNMVYHKPRICQIKSKTLKHIFMDLHLRTSNGFIMKHLNDEFSYTTCIVNIEIMNNHNRLYSIVHHKL